MYSKKKLLTIVFSIKMNYKFFEKKNYFNYFYYKKCQKKSTNSI